MSSDILCLISAALVTLVPFAITFPERVPTKLEMARAFAYAHVELQHRLLRKDDAAVHALEVAKELHGRPDYLYGVAH